MTWDEVAHSFILVEAGPSGETIYPAVYNQLQVYIVILIEIQYNPDLKIMGPSRPLGSKFKFAFWHCAFIERTSFHWALGSY